MIVRAIESGILNLVIEQWVYRDHDVVEKEK